MCQVLEQSVVGVHRLKYCKSSFKYSAFRCVNPSHQTNVQLCSRNSFVNLKATSRTRLGLNFSVNTIAELTAVSAIEFCTVLSKHKVNAAPSVTTVKERE